MRVQWSFGTAGPMGAGAWRLLEPGGAGPLPSMAAGALVSPSVEGVGLAALESSFLSAVLRL